MDIGYCFRIRHRRREDRMKMNFSKDELAMVYQYAATLSLIRSGVLSRSGTIPSGVELTSTGRHAPCGKRMIARSVPAPANHHRGSYTSPALAAASYLPCGLAAGDTLRCKLFTSSEFYSRVLYFSEIMKYNEVSDKLEVA